MIHHREYYDKKEVEAERKKSIQERERDAGNWGIRILFKKRGKQLKERTEEKDQEVQEREAKAENVSIHETSTFTDDDDEADETDV